MLKSNFSTSARWSSFVNTAATSQSVSERRSGSPPHFRAHWTSSCVQHGARLPSVCRCRMSLDLSAERRSSVADRDLSTSFLTRASLTFWQRMATRIFHSRPCTRWEIIGDSVRPSCRIGLLSCLLMRADWHRLTGWLYFSATSCSQHLRGRYSRGETGKFLEIFSMTRNVLETGLLIPLVWKPGNVGEFG